MKIIIKIIVLISLQLISNCGKLKTKPISQKVTDPLHYVYGLNGNNNGLILNSEKEFKAFFEEGIKKKNENKSEFSKITLVEIKKNSLHLTNKMIDQLCKILPELKNLNLLKLSGLQIGINGAKNLGKCITKLATLKEIDLSENNLNEKEKEKIKQSLDLHEPKIEVKLGGEEKSLNNLN